MKKNVKKILASLLTIVTLFSMVPMMGITATAATQSGTCGENLTWTLDIATGEFSINGIGEMRYGSFYMGDSRPWSDYVNYIKRVTIGDGVTTIFDGAFCDCKNLTDITVPESVTLIGSYAFASCSSLTSIIIPDSVTEIENFAFYDCNALISITIPNYITTIDAWAFSACTNLTNITIPNTVKSIGTGAFFYSDSITDVYYNGTQEEWNQISIGEDNESLLNATIHFKTTDSNAVGDPNNDGKINSSDALVCLQHSVGKTKLTGNAFTAGDVDKNGKINSTDALQILQYSVGKIEKL